MRRTLAVALVALALASCRYTLRGMRLTDAERQQCQTAVGAQARLLTVATSPPLARKTRAGLVTELVQVVPASQGQLTVDARGSGTLLVPACTAFDRLPPHLKVYARNLGYREGEIVGVIVSPVKKTVLLLELIPARDLR